MARLIPGAEIVFTGEVGEDPRDYRVRFDLLRELLPDFRPEFDLESGMAELHRQMVDHGFDARDFEGPKYVRLRTLRARLDRLGAVPRLSGGAPDAVHRDSASPARTRSTSRSAATIGASSPACSAGTSSPNTVSCDAFVQVNNSLSAERGTLRGMHYQLPPHAETKLVRCIRGRSST